MPEVCGNAAELAASGTAEALRASIEAVVYNAERVDDLRKAGLRQIAKFSWSKTARDTAACYRELV